jgi:hypothetical protein
MFKRLLALVLGFLALPAMGQSPQLGASDLLPNMLSGYNPGFENGLQRWTKAGSSTFTQTTTAANVAFGNGAASWTPGAANDTLTSTQVTVPSGLFGRMCMGAAWIKASDAVTTFQVINGSSTVQASTVLASSSTYQRYQVAFTCPSSGTLAVQLKASGAGSAVLLDQVYLGATTEMPVVDFNETTTPGNPIAGKLRVYGKSDNNLYFLNSSGTEQQVGSGSGQKNYIQTSSNTAAGWTSSANGNLTVTTDTTVADLPRPQTTKSAVVFTGVSGNSDYGFVNFQLDPSDYNVKQQVSFSQACGLAGAASAIAGCAASNFRVDVYSCTVAWSGTPANTCSGTATRLALSNDSAAVTALPALTGQFRTTFDAPGSAAPYLQIRVGLNATTTHAIALSDVVVGPGIVTQGAAVSDDVAWTPTVSGFGTVTGLTANYAQVGDYIIGKVQFTAGTVAASLASITLPNSWTTSDGVQQGSLQLVVGHWDRLTTTATAVKNGVIQVASTASNLLFFGKEDYTGTDSPNTHLNGSSIVGTGDIIELTFRVRIDQLVGSGTVNVTQNDCSYLSNSSTSDANDTTSFVYGPAGSTFPGALTTMRNKRVRSLTPISSTTQLYLQVQVGGSTAPWSTIGNGDSDTGIVPITYQTAGAAANTYGLGFNLGNIVNGTDIDVAFGHYAYANGATYGAAGASWNTASGNWRVVVCQAGQAIGFGIYQAGGTTGAGLIPATGFPGGKSTDSNLGTITNVSLSAYYEGTFDTFWNSGGLSQHVTARYTRAGNMVTIFFPGTSTFTGSGTVAATAAIPSALLNSSYGAEVDFPIARLINGGTTGATGLLKVDFTSGTMTAQVSAGGAFSGANSQLLAFTIAYPIN